MATILEQYRKRQNDIREQIAANSLPLDQVLIMQELNYRICVLETFESLCKSAPVTMDTKSMGFHFQLVDAYAGAVQNLHQQLHQNDSARLDAVSQHLYQFLRRLSNESEQLE